MFDFNICKYKISMHMLLFFLSLFLIFIPFGCSAAENSALTEDVSLLSNTVNISYNLGDGVSGTPPESVVYESNSVLLLPEMPNDVLNLNKVFSGWMCSADDKIYGAGESYNVPANDVIFTAAWTDGYTYWFFHQWDDSASWMSGTVSEKKPVEALKKACEKAGYDLDVGSSGWIKTMNGKGTVDAPDYSYSTYWVTFDYNESQKKWVFSDKVIGYLPDSTYFAYVYGDVDLYNLMSPNLRIPGVPEKPYKAGYKFDGYFKDESLTQPYDFSVFPTEDVRLYVKWTPAPLYTITFDTVGVEPGIPEKLLTSESFFVVPLYMGKNPGYDFKGWTDLSNTFYKTPEYYTVADKNDVLKAVWAPKSLKITFDPNGGEGSMEALKFTYNLEISLPENLFTKENFVFDSWNTKEDGSGDSFPDKSVYPGTSPKNIKLYAQWSAVYQVLFPKNPIGYTIEFLTDVDLNAVVENTDIRFRIIVEEGFEGVPVVTCNGVSLNPEDGVYTLSKISENSSVNISGITVKPQTYSVTYVAEGASPESVPKDSNEYEAGETVSVLFDPVPEKQNFEFTGWAYDPDAKEPDFVKNEGENSFSVLKNTSLYAVWKKKTPDPGVFYTVRYDLNGGTGAEPPSSFEVQKNETFIVARLPENVKNGDLEFKGWFLSYANKTYMPGDRLRAGSQSITLCAVWGNKSSDPSNETVSIFFMDGEDVIFTHTVSKGHNVLFDEIPFIFFKGGYILKGFSQNGQIINDGFEARSDVSLSVVWKKLPILVPRKNKSSGNFDDALMFLKYISGTGSYKEKTVDEIIELGLDFDNDGKINLVDVLIYLKNCEQSFSPDE